MLLQYTPSDVDDKLIEISFMFIVALYGMAVQSFLPKLLFKKIISDEIRISI